MTRAPFLSLDGIDGTGKSTQCRLLVEWLNAAGVPAVACADPGGTPIGDQLRELLLASRADLSDRAEALLFMASRAELVAKVIRPALVAGRVGSWLVRRGRFDRVLNRVAGTVFVLLAARLVVS